MDYRVEQAKRIAQQSGDWEDVQAAATTLRRVGRGHEAQQIQEEHTRPDRAREDRHRPSVIEPNEYTFVRGIYFGSFPNTYDRDSWNYLKQVREEGLEFVKANGRGSCDICGAGFVHGAIFKHNTGEHIIVGWICAEKLQLMTADAFRVLAVSKKRRATVSRLRKEWRELRRACEQLPKDVRVALKGSHRITQDIRERFVRYKRITEAQQRLVLKIHNEEKTPKTQEKRVPAPEGKLVVSGEVVSVKEKRGLYGTQIKVAVKVTTPEGSWVTWGTLPKALQDAERGDKIQFTATLKRSQNDLSFSFFSRPSKASFVK